MFRLPRPNLEVKKMYNFAPMLAERKSVHDWHDKVTFPVYVSPKLDGIRCSILNGQAVSRSLKSFPNKHISSILSDSRLSGLDGELIVGEATAEDVFSRTQSVVMSKTSEPCDFAYIVFDDFTQPARSYHSRLVDLEDKVSELRMTTMLPIFIAQVRRADNWAEVVEYETRILEQGYEGVILRAPSAPYKFGRSTAKEQGMLKLKRFTDSEAKIVGFEELMRNANEAYENELGFTKRSSAKEGLVPGNTLGAFIVESDMGKFNIGMFKGLTSADKQKIWNERESFLGKFVKFSYFPVGVKDLPRHPKFIGFRDHIDM